MTTSGALGPRWLMALGAFTLIWLARCGGYERGIEVQVALRPQVPVQSIRTDQDYLVSLEGITMHVSSVRLIPCAGTLTHLKALLTTTAYAHHVDVSPEQGEGEGTLHLLEANGNPMSITTLRPPPGTYCYAELTFGPASDDPLTEGMTLHGRAERDGQVQEFDWHLRQSPPLALELRPRLQLHAQALDNQLLFDLEQSRLLDGHDFNTSAEPVDLSARLRSALKLLTMETSL